MSWSLVAQVSVLLIVIAIVTFIILGAVAAFRNNENRRKK